ncbi:stress responsive protein [Marinomonas ushuaiensis DSM 15871]|uniref:Stress responsive protein n=1 Tax=Marinomonas ushuaiensis DSM 15871 TaxID=1122207 RepID=X7E4G3_9GAMM|nr:Dabb family protein [Marinomonas ushuaiensis]ETX10068.1 stress responsive protein [Marinomonas ushuaiensis DSM 15871]
MIRHVVLFKVRPEVAAADFNILMQEIADLESSVSGFISFEHGPNQTPETRDQGYNYGFVLTLASWVDLDAYQNNSRHQITGAKLIAACNSNYDGLLVFDMEV